MEYFIIERHEECARIVNDDCDAYGMDLRCLSASFPFCGNFLVFSGNFWWSKASYVKILPDLNAMWLKNNKNRYTAEIFIGLMLTKPCSYYINPKIPEVLTNWTYWNSLRKKVKFL